MDVEEPLQLVDLSGGEGDGGGSLLQIKYDNLDRVLSRSEGRPLSIICICGPSRQGKSFILGHMIRCLEALVEDEPDWMDWDNKTKPLNGFKFRNGTSPETKGIWIWSKPFLCTVGPDDKEIAVLLLDTQGTFDEFTTRRTMASIVGLSMLMSSCMIFNSFKHLQEDLLIALKSYIEYGLLAMEHRKDSQGKPFQKLTFLIRDWNMPGDYPYGSKGGKEFLENKLQIKGDQSPEAKNVREMMRKCFESMDCYLMPHPGDKAIMPDFKGSIDELNITFAKKLEDFISNLISPDDLDSTIKHIFGDVISGTELKTLMEMYVEIFNSDEMPSPLTMLEATIQVINQNAMGKALQKYQEVLRKHQRTKQYLSDDALQNAHTQGRKLALEHFKKHAKGDKTKLEDLDEELDKRIAKEFNETKRKNADRIEKFVEGAIKEALISFNEDMESEFSFESDDSVFYLEKQVKSKISSAIDNLLEEFQEKLEDDSNQFATRLEQKLKEAQEAILLENITRHNQAESTATKIMEISVESHEFLMNKYLNENPHEDTEIFGKFLEDDAKKYIDEFRNTKLSGPKEFHKICLENMESRLAKTDSDLMVAHKAKLQKAQLETSELITELENGYKKVFEEFCTCSLSPLEISDVNSFHRENQPRFEEMFKEKTCYPETSPNFSQALETLTEKLSGIYEAICYRVIEEARRNQEAANKALEESYNFYHNEMTKVFQSSMTLSEMDIQSESQQLTRQAAQMLEDAGAADENMESLMSKLVADLEDMKIENEQKLNLAKSESKNLVTECHSEYQTEMKTCMDKLGSEESLQEAHAIALDKSIESFKNQCKIKNEDFMESFITELRDEIKETFEEVLELFELKIGEKEGLTLEALSDARKFYNGEMGKEFANHEFIRPNDLQQLHNDLCEKAVAQCCAAAPLTEAQKTELRLALEQSLDKYKEENDMNLDVEEPAIGIDLGTTYSCVAVYARGKVHVIQNAQGKKTTPSYVAFNPDGSHTVGEPAKNKAYENPENTIFDAKRILGRKFTDEKLQEDMRLWAFTVEDDSGVPKIKIRENKLYPEQVSAKVLTEMKESAEKFLKRPVKKAVITVPAYFTDGQRQATKDAGDLAGLEVLTILTEPVAAAIAYKKQHADEGGNRNVLIFDLGGGTFDVAVLTTSHGKIDVLAVSGDDHLGGEDFDRNLMNYCAQEFQQQHNINLFEGKDVGQTREAVRRRLKRLQMECERKKIDLTSGQMTEISVDSIYERTDLSVTITRNQFEQLNEPLFSKTIGIVEECLAEAKMDKHKIQDIVLVGGSTRIPKIQELLRSFFGGKALDHSINPDEAVAYGAAMKAAFMNGSIAKQSIDFTKIQDVIPMSLGVEVYGGGFSVIIPKSTKIPVKLKERYKTAHNNQTSVQVTIYQGEEIIALHNKHLGDFYLNGIPPMDAEVENVDVEMVINAQGILHVNAVCGSSGVSSSITVTENKQRMSRAVIKRLLDEGDAGAAA